MVIEPISKPLRILKKLLTKSSESVRNGIRGSMRMLGANPILFSSSIFFSLSIKEGAFGSNRALYTGLSGARPIEGLTNE